MIQLDLKELRAKYKDPHQCLQVDLVLLDKLVQRLFYEVQVNHQSNKYNGGSNINLILLIISNILLINRNLNQTYFKPVYSSQLLKFLNQCIFEIIPIINYYHYNNLFTIGGKKSFSGKITTKIGEKLGKFATNLKINSERRISRDERKSSHDERKLSRDEKRLSRDDRKSYTEDKKSSNDDDRQKSFEKLESNSQIHLNDQFKQNSPQFIDENIKQNPKFINSSPNEDNYDDINDDINENDNHKNEIIVNDVNDAKMHKSDSKLETSFHTSELDKLFTSDTHLNQDSNPEKLRSNSGNKLFRLFNFTHNKLSMTPDSHEKLKNGSQSNINSISNSNEELFMKSLTPTLNISNSNSSHQASLSSNTPSNTTMENKILEKGDSSNSSCKNAVLESNADTNYNSSHLLTKSKSSLVDYFNLKKLDSGGKTPSGSPNTYANIIKATSVLNVHAPTVSQKSAYTPQSLPKSGIINNSKAQSPITAKFAKSDTNLFSKFTSCRPKQIDITGLNHSLVDPISIVSESDGSNSALKLEHSSVPDLKHGNTADSINTWHTKSSPLSLRSHNSKDTTASSSIVFEVDFETLIPFYRLIFLILYDEVDELSQSTLDNTDKALIRGLNYCLNDGFDQDDFYIETLSNNQKENLSSVLIQPDIDNNDHYNLQNSILPNFQLQDQYHILATIEILKCLYSFYHKHPEYINLGITSLPYLMSIVIMICESPSINNSNLNLLLKNLINVITIISTNSGNVEYYNLPIYRVFSKKLMRLAYRRLMSYLSKEEVEINDISSLFILITYLAKEFTRHSCRVALSIFQKNIVPTELDNIPIIYTQCLKILTLPDRLFDMNQITQERMKLKHLIYECFYELCWRPAKEEHYKVFLECVGFVNAKNYVLNNRSDILSVIDVKCYSNPLFFEMNTSISEHEKLMNPLAINESFKDILRNHKENPAQFLDMTEEEKEAEAEKLYVIFDRMEKTGVFQNFKNPIKEWQQSGRFEDLDDTSNNYETK